MVNATPNSPAVQGGASTTQSSVKKAEPDKILISSQSIPVDAIPQLLLENLGAHELMSISRHDMVNGQSVSYRPIKNLSELANAFGPQTLVALQTPGNVIFNNFSIRLGEHVPDVGTGPLGEIVYVEKDSRNLIVNVFNMAEDEQVEVEILVSGLIQDDTIDIEE